MRDIGKWPAMHESRVVFQGLHKVGLHCIFQKHSHRAIGFDITAVNWCFIAPIRHDDITQPLLQIVKRICQA